MFKPIIYEHPLNERIRQFLRLERLFVRLEHHSRINTLWDTQVCVQLILELSGFTNRGDLKNEVLKEVEHQHSVLKTLCHSDDINQDKLLALLNKQKNLMHSLYDSDGRLSANVRNNELLNAVQQRIMMPGGGCDFDLPAYHQWLHSPMDERLTLIQHWTAPFKHVKEAILLCLEITRLSSETQQINAQGGYYERAVAPEQAVQLIRMNLNHDLTCYPEVSAGKQRFTIRFFEMRDTTTRPVQIKDDIQLSVSICGL